MLPNWLLGKSKSKLQEILGGGGGGTAYTAGDGIDISNGVISFDPETAKTQITNPNLLDNPWFTINQREESSYNAIGYTVDRWKIQTGGITASISADGLTLSNTGSDYRNFNQNHEASFWSFLDGKMLTLSLMLSNGTILSKSQIVDFSQNASYCKVTYTDVNDKKSWCNIRSTGTAIMIQFVLEAGASITIKAVKLELGSVSTLAMDTAPNYATELLKCRRYYQRININFAVIQGILADATNARFPIKLEPEMREVPSFTISNIADFVATRGYYADASALSSLDLLSGANSKQFVVLNAVLTTAKDARDPIFLGKTSDTPGGYIDLSAEL